MVKLPQIQLISAPSILGLAPTGVQYLPQCFLEQALATRLSSLPVIEVPTLNNLYSAHRDVDTHCINSIAIHDFSTALGVVVEKVLNQQQFPVILGGDCSILLGILPALKQRGRYGLVFADAHADFYQPEKSTTGQVADMDLAIVTGRGPGLLTNIFGMKPYMADQDVLHIGQRDEMEAAQYGSQDIRTTGIHCISLAAIREKGIDHFFPAILSHAARGDINGCWIHFDTDVLDDAINPAVDYRLPGGLTVDEIRKLFNALIRQGHVVGMSVTIYNPQLDPDVVVGKIIVDCLVNVLV